MKGLLGGGVGTEYLPHAVAHVESASLVKARHRAKRRMARRTPGALDDGRAIGSLRGSGACPAVSASAQAIAPAKKQKNVPKRPSKEKKGGFTRIAHPRRLARYCS